MTKISLLITGALLLLLYSPVIAQDKPTFRNSDLFLSFTAVANNYTQTGEAKGEFIIANTGTSVLPATGWKIYFNSKSNLVTEHPDAVFNIKKWAGNLFEISPGISFKGILPGNKISFDVLMEGAFINRNDQPEGFYIVWNEQPLKGYDIKYLIENKISLPVIDGRLESDFAKNIYQRNNATTVIKDNLSKIFPQPVSYIEPGSVAILSATTKVSADSRFANEARLLRDELNSFFEKKEVASSGTIKSILMNYVPDLATEGYELKVTTDAIIINASESAGIFYGIQSLKTLLPADVWIHKQTAINIPSVMVKDQPRFSYRGLMLDVARNFQKKEEVFRILDLMALYKLNTFHFHITDDEGWRLEIDGLPELTSFGALRGHSLDEKYHLPSAYGSGADTGKLYGSGFYSRKDFMEILKYAQERHIDVIPEIETPGHARAAIKAMDARYRRLMEAGKPTEALQYLLRDTLDHSVYSTPQWFHDNIMDVAVPSVYTFIEKVVDEIDRLYKEAGVRLRSIHFGGDEVAAGTWEQSPACRMLIFSDPSVRTTDDLWYYYISKVSAILQKKGIGLSGWEEIGLRKTLLDGNKMTFPNPEFANRHMHLYVWNNIGGNEDLAYKLANNGYQVVLAPVTNFYFDQTQYKTYDEPGYYWGSVTDIKKTYEFIPYDLLKNIKEDDQGRAVTAADFSGKQRLTDYGKTNIIGLQACMWSETIKGPQQLEYMLLPRLAALAERAWAKDPSWATETDPQKTSASYDSAWAGFVNNVGTIQLPILSNYHGGYNYRIPPVGAIVKDGAIFANTQFPGLTIRYSTDSNEPTKTSPVFQNGMKAKGTVKLRVFNGAGRSSYTTIVNSQ